MTSDPRFTVPLYTAAGAAAHLNIGDATLKRWANRDTLITCLPAAGSKAPRLPFIALVEAQFYRELRRAGLSMQAITTGMKSVRQVLGERMFTQGSIATDGTDILMNLADQGDPDWARARDRQPGLPGIINIGLRPITWDADGLPARLKLTAYHPAPVIADPAYAFGQPIIETSGARIEDILALFKAGEKLNTVAAEMRITPTDVEAIVRTQLALAA
jgi:uncharacterized protein (DUF433 family)